MNAIDLFQTIDSQFDSHQAVHTLGGKQVLLAEDCREHGRLYLKLLQRAGAAVTLECNGQSAIESVSKSPTRFDAIVMDFQMPKRDGLDATRQLRELGYSGAIIGVTGFGADELKRSWFQAGCDDYLEKPLKMDELVSAVFRHTTRRSKDHELLRNLL